jgi:SPP1 gp7 family putative phage head morphogenesis protein
MRELDLQGLLPNVYSEKYYKVIYEIQQGYNIGRALEKLDDMKLDTLISKPWASDGLTFSDRIWRDRDQLVNILNTEFKQSLIRGEAPDKIIKIVADKMGTSRSNAGRLIMTESAYISSVSQERSFREMDVDMYEYVATLDQDTSEQCRSADKWDPLPMSAYEIGVTAPPLHQWCRSTTVPYFPDNYTERFARGAEGETYFVEDMNYEEWYSQYVA